MPLFRSKAEDTLAVVQAKLAAARDTLAVLETETRERALEAATTDDPGAALAPMSEKVAAARATVHALELAEAEAQRQETKRLAQVADDAEKSRRRAAGQHAGAARRAAIKIREALEQAVAAYDELISVAERAERVFTSAERNQLIGPGGLRSALNDLVRTAMAQANGHRGDQRPIDRFPLVPSGRLFIGANGQHITQVAALEDAVAQRFDLAGLLRSPGWTGRPVAPPPAADVQRGPDVAGQVPARAPRADALTRPVFDEVELPAEVTKALEVVGDPTAHTPEELAAAQAALAGY